MNSQGGPRQPPREPPRELPREPPRDLAREPREFSRDPGSASGSSSGPSRPPPRFPSMDTYMTGSTSNGLGPTPPPLTPIVTRPRLEGYTENGRFYGGYRRGRYLFRYDENEKDRLDIFHKFFLVARKDTLHNAPIHNQANPRILDLGCGTGIWAIDMSDKFPGGQVFGVDLEFIQPEFIPANLHFDQMDIEEPWKDLGLGSWDMIHMRAMRGALSHNKWPTVYAEIYRHLRPYYGVLEQVEIDYTPRSHDGSLPPNSFVGQWASELYGAMDRLDRPMRVDSDQIKRMMNDSGLVEIKEEIIKIAYNGWPSDNQDKETGRWFNLELNQGIHALTIAPLYRGYNKQQEEVNLLINNVKDEIRSRNLHAYCTMHIFTARRPQ